LVNLFFLLLLINDIMNDQWLKTLLKEEEEIENKTAEEQDSLDNYALYIDAGRHSSDYILYKPKYYAQKMKEEIDNAKKEFEKIRFKGNQFGKFKDFYAFSNVKDIFKDPNGVYGFVSVNNGRIIGPRGSCNRANEIRSISAREGFGRLMFMIALAKESPIMSNREDVSVNAYNYLTKFTNNQNITIEPFENEKRLAKKDNEDCKVFGSKILDQSYKSASDIDIEAQPLLNRHKVFLHQMKNYFTNNGVDFILSRIKQYISDAGTYFFDERRGEPGWYESYTHDEED